MLNEESSKIEESNEVWLKTARPSYKDKVCLRCRNKGHIAKRCPGETKNIQRHQKKNSSERRHVNDQWMSNTLHSSQDRYYPSDARMRMKKASRTRNMGKQEFRMNTGSSRYQNVSFVHKPQKPSQVRHDNVSKSFASGFKQKIVSTFKSFQNKWFEPKQVWRVKSKVETIVNEAKDLTLQEVTYTDAKGQSRTTMAWVPLSD